MNRCCIIALESGDRMGKATQANMLYDELSRSHSVTVVEVPCDGYTYKLIYWMLKNGSAKRLPNLFQLVHFANKLGFELFTLPGIKHLSDYVIMDRWRLSAIVYGKVTGVNPRLNRFLNDMLIKPDMTIVLTGKKYARDEEKDVYEADDNLQKAVEAAYWEHALANKDDHELVSNHGSKEDVHATILGVLAHRGIIDNVRGDL